MKKVLVLTDMSSIGSGYKYICTPLLTGLSELGYDIKVLGLMYKGEEHDSPFSIIPAGNFQDALFMMNNLKMLWDYDVIVVALDIPHHVFIVNELERLFKDRMDGIPYIAITPLENGPLIHSWVAELFRLSWVFFISMLGASEAQQAGLTISSHLQVGIDTDFWKPVSKEQKIQMRKAMDIPDDEFVFLTVAENQERKNLWALFDILGKVKKETGKKFRYILVTREHNNVGWKLRDLADTYDISNELHILERGLDQDTLLSLYQLSDLFLLGSKAEGLGIPVLEAMASGLPVLATNTGAITELLMDGRGYLIDNEYSFLDVWGNSRRDMIDRKRAANTIKEIMIGITNGIGKYREYAESRTWDIPVEQLANKIEELTDGKKEKKDTE